jgi:hypothetical protein
MVEVNTPEPMKVRGGGNDPCVGSQLRSQFVGEEIGCEVVHRDVEFVSLLAYLVVESCEPGVVAEDVDAVGGFAYSPSQASYLPEIGEVSHFEGGRAASGFDAPDRLFAGCPVASVNDDSCTGVSESDRGHTPDTARCPSDYCCLPRHIRELGHGFIEADFSLSPSGKCLNGERPG